MDQKTDKQQAILTAEMRRRRRERIIIVATIIGIVLLTFIETSLFSKETLVPDFRDVAIFALININIILVLLLIFLIVRNIVKLVYERRRGVLGSKLRTKLVAAFVTLSLVPTFILFLVATNFLSYSIDNWFNIRVGGALNLSLEVAQNYYQQTAENVKYYADQMSADITKNRLYEKSRLEYLRSLVEQRQRIFKLGLIEVYFNDEADKIVFKDPSNPDIPELGLSPKLREDIRSGKHFTTMQSVGLGDFIRGIAPIYVTPGSTAIIGAVVVNCYVPKGLVDKMTTISRINEEYKQFKLLKNPIKTSYIVILFVVTLLIIFSATWFGFYLAHPTWMGRTAWFKNFRYRPLIAKAEDQDLLLRAYRSSTFACLPEELIKRLDGAPELLIFLKVIPQRVEAFQRQGLVCQPNQDAFDARPELVRRIFHRPQGGFQVERQSPQVAGPDRPAPQMAFAASRHSPKQAPMRSSGWAGGRPGIRGSLNPDSATSRTSPYHLDPL